MIAVALALTACNPSPSPAPPATSPATSPSPRSEATAPAPTPESPSEVSQSETSRDDPGAQPLDQVSVALEPFVQLSAPTAMAVRPSDDALYFAERGGVVRAVRDGAADKQPVLDLSGQVSTGGERGLLGLTFSSDGSELYVSYTNSDGDSRLDAYPMRDGGAVVDQRRELLAVEQPYANHNGGNVVLGPDGMLYLGLGDGGAGGDPQGNAQNPQTLLGKMVRLNPATGAAPADNPFVDDEAYLPQIFAVGLRNPWRFSFDRATDDLWVADVGQNSVEEVNVTPAQQSAGRNYGWDLFEGSQPYEGDQLPPRAVTPVVEYATGKEGCAVTGGFVYRGDAIPGLSGAYLYSDFCSGWIRAVRYKDGRVVERRELEISSSEVASFGEDADGELYVLSLGGEVSRVVGG